VTTNRALIFPAFFCLVCLMTAPTQAADPAGAQATKPQAPAIQIEMVQVADIWIPAEFTYSIYEHLVEQVVRSGGFQKVFRAGDRQAEGAADVVVLRTKVEKFKEGSQMKREMTTVLGATRIDVSATVSTRDGRVLLEKNIQGKVLFFGQNLSATRDLAKRIAKLLNQNIETLERPVSR